MTFSIFSNPRLKSSIISSMCSVPIDKRFVVGVIPTDNTPLDSIENEL